MSKTETLPSQLGQITTDLRALVGEADQLNAEYRKRLILIFAKVHLWVETAIVEGRATNRLDAQEKLAATLKRGVSCIRNWFYCGLLMHDERLDTHCDARSVREVATRKDMLAKHEYLKCVDIIKKHGPHEDVVRIIRRSASVTVATAEKTAYRLSKDGKLDKNRLRMQMMALRTMAGVFYGKGDVAVEIRDGTKLLERVE